MRTGAGCWAAETVGEMLSTQFGELPGTVVALATWDACPWGLGLDVRGTREPHWTGDALTATANTHFGSSGALAWIDRERGLGLVALASRSSYSGWWSRAGGWPDLSAAVRERYCAAFNALGLASTTSKSAPVMRPRACRSSSLKCGLLRRRCTRASVVRKDHPVRLQRLQHDARWRP